MSYTLKDDSLYVVLYGGDILDRYHRSGPHKQLRRVYLWIGRVLLICGLTWAMMAAMYWQTGG